MKTDVDRLKRSIRGYNRAKADAEARKAGVRDPQNYNLDELREAIIVRLFGLHPDG